MISHPQIAQNYAQSDPDVALMLRVQAHDDADAFEALVHRYEDKVQHQLQLILGDQLDVEDLAQEVFIRVYRHRQRYRPKAKFVTYLFHILRNVARNALRERRRKPTLSLSKHKAARSATDAFADERMEAPSQPLERGELRSVVRLALRQLQDRQRHALFLQQFEDRSYTEIADRLHLSPEAAKSLLYRARNQIRETLHPYVHG